MGRTFSSKLKSISSLMSFSHKPTHCSASIESTTIFSSDILYHKRVPCLSGPSIWFKSAFVISLCVKESKNIPTLIFDNSKIRNWFLNTSKWHKFEVTCSDHHGSHSNPRPLAEHELPLLHNHFTFKIWSRHSLSLKNDGFFSRSARILYSIV